MIVDTSAILAIALGEPGWEMVASALTSDPNNAMAAPTYVELRAVATRRLDTAGVRLVDRLLKEAEISVVPFDAAHAEVAARAYADFGKGSGHPAALNLGDTFSYALAIVEDQPLLFVGNDFSLTDVRRAL